LLDLIFQNRQRRRFTTELLRNTKQLNNTKQQKQYIAVKGVYMRGKTFISTLACVAIMACGTAFAQQHKLQSGPYHGPLGPMVAPEAPAAPDAIFYTNLAVDPCTGMKYDVNNGALLVGPNNCGIPALTQWLAEPFVSNATGPVTKVTMSITNWGICTPTSNKFTVQIYDDANCNGLPGNPLGSPVQASSPAAPPALASANFGTTGPLLARGLKYWVVVTTGPQASQNATTSVWWEATTSIEPFNINDGSGWQAGFLGGVGGFQVQ
jgi:hypothetical protein